MNFIGVVERQDGYLCDFREYQEEVIEIGFSCQQDVKFGSYDNWVMERIIDRYVFVNGYCCQDIVFCDIKRMEEVYLYEVVSQRDGFLFIYQVGEYFGDGSCGILDFQERENIDEEIYGGAQSCVQLDDNEYYQVFSYDKFIDKK